MQISSATTTIIGITAMLCPNIGERAIQGFTETRIRRSCIVEALSVWLWQPVGCPEHTCRLYESLSVATPPLIVFTGPSAYYV